jgi:alanine dehydrogenase
MVRVLSDQDVATVLDLRELLDVVERAFVKQGRGEVERPDRPHFPVGVGLDETDPDRPLGTGLVMPAYLHESPHYATKLVGVHEGNADRGLPTVQAQIAVTDAADGTPAAFVAGTRITNARTGCIGGLAARELAAAPVRLAVFGAGTQARWQTRAIDAATGLESVRIYSPSDSKYDCATDLAGELDASVSAAESPEDALADATVVVTATTSTEPVFPGTALEPGTLVVAVGAYTAEMQELDARTFERAACVFADVPGEVAGIGDALGASLDEEDLIPLSEVFEGQGGRESDDDILVVESVGTAVLDAATADYVLSAAEREGVGTVVPL